MQLGDLRSALHAAPSPEAFQRVVDIVAALPDTEHALRYASHLLEHWPEASRHLPIPRAQALIEACPEAAKLLLGVRSAHVGDEYGYAETAPASQRASLELADTLLRAGTVRHLDLSGSYLGDAVLERVLDHGTPLRALELRNNGLTHKALTALSRAHHLSGLRLLDLSSIPSFMGELVEGQRNIIHGQDIVRATQLEQLEALHLAFVRLHREDIHDLIRAKHLAGLRSVSFGGQASADDTLCDELTEATHLTQLEHLSLRCAALRPQGVVTLIETEHLCTLRSLELSNTIDFGFNRIGNDGLDALARATHLPYLDTLGLADHEIPEEGMTTLMKAAHYRWRKLDLAGVHRFPVSSLAPLRDGQQFERLVFLCLNSLFLGPELAKLLADSESLVSLRHLGLAGNRIGAEGMHALRQASCLSQLELLDLSSNATDDERFEVATVDLLCHGDWPVLHTLRLADAPYGHEMARGLASCEFPALRILDLEDCRIDAKARAILEQAPWFAQLELCRT